MEFSTDAYKHTGPVCFSPDARFLAIAVDYRLVVRDVNSLKVPALFVSLTFYLLLVGLSARN